MFKMMRKILKDMEMKDNVLKIYNPYFQVSVVPEKTTFSGTHKEKLMFSFGLRYDDAKAQAFFDSDDPLKEQIVERMSKQLNISQENIIKSYKTGKLKDLLIDWVDLQVKALGIPIVFLKHESAFEIYSYVKSSDPDEILDMIRAMVIGLGRCIKISFDKDQEKELTYYETALHKGLDKFLKKGFDE